MEHELSPDGYGIAAFAILERILPRLVEKELFTKAEIAGLLDEIAHVKASRGIANNNDADTSAARLVGSLAITARR